MKVREMLRAKGQGVETIAASEPVSRAIQALTKMRIGALVVSPDGVRVDGVISERDIVRGLARYGAGLVDMSVKDVMSRDVPTCAPDDDVTMVMSEITHRRERHMPVVQDSRLQGIVSIGDVLKSRLDDLELQAAVMRDITIARQ
ncbi:MAG TPA: CBS domain-containing protein [Acidimicrobiales bacterium]|nr:CBS domain-containing protein [Acidimicrobiales bacterium]